MCGIAGLWSPAGLRPGVELESIASAMTRSLQHRGPDAEGLWADAPQGLCLGHRRLSILDLSPAGAQPMHSACGRYVIAYNGEIYNHLAVRAQLPPQAWRGHSDTETLLAAIAHLGLEEALRRSAGMFALALWDRQSRTLALARDRLGEKPLYHGRIGDDIVFGSELKALRMHPGFRGGVDREALASLLARGCIGAPLTIHPGLHKLPPGTVLTLRLRDDGTVATSDPVAYWSMRSVVEGAMACPPVGPEEAVQQLDALLQEVVREQVVADVPVGAFLSGGTDSSLVVATMRRVTQAPVRTFTIGFPSSAHDESAYARRVAQHLGTEHTELQFNEPQALDFVQKTTDWFDEPFGDSSALPTFLVSMLARRHVTVCLSGDGGDEMFGGYTRYGRLQRHWARVSRWPLGLRRAAAWLAAPDMLPPRVRAALHLAGSGSPAEFYGRMISQWPAYARAVLGAAPPMATANLPAALADEPIAGAMFADTLGYLPDDILAKVDRTAMANSLEVRIPLLDQRIVEWAWSLPVALRRQGGVPKWPLRALLARHLPQELIERPKMGFGVPLDDWLRTALRPWAEDLLAEDRLRREGFFDVSVVRRAWQRHLAGDAQLRDVLWPVLMFQQWLGSGHAAAASGNAR